MLSIVFVQQEQPLLLEDLLEQEKRELQRQQQQQQHHPMANSGGNPNNANRQFLSDTDFEKLKADVLSGGLGNVANVSLSPPNAMPNQRVMHVQQQQQPQMQHQQQQVNHFQHPQQAQHQQQQQGMMMMQPGSHSQQQPQQMMVHHRPPGHFVQQQGVQQHPQQQGQFVRAPMPPQQQQQWQMQQQRQVVGATGVPDMGIHPAILQQQQQQLPHHVNSNVSGPGPSSQAANRPPLPPPILATMPAPSETIVLAAAAASSATGGVGVSSANISEADRQQLVSYENWMAQQQNLLRMHQQYFETEVTKLRKFRKTLNSRQRQLRKNGQELPDADGIDLERVTAEQQSLQKQLEQVRRQARQHTMLVQDYRNKRNPQPPQQQMMNPIGGPVVGGVMPGQGQGHHQPSPSPSPGIVTL